MEMLRAIRRSSGGEEELRELVARWAEFLGREALPGTELLPPGHLDCLPVNLILDRGGAMHYIDDEWVWNGPVPVDWVLFRGLFVFWLECRTWIDRFLSRQDAGFVAFLASALSTSPASIDRKRLEEMARLETALQAAVSPFDPLDYRGMLEEARPGPSLPSAPAAGKEEAARVARVEELYASGEVLPALRLAGDLTKEYPGNATNWNNIGVMLDALGKRDDARECFRAALARDPGHPDARKNLASLDRIS
jgi:hypothetical protein